MCDCGSMVVAEEDRAGIGRCQAWKHQRRFGDSRTTTLMRVMQTTGGLEEGGDGLPGEPPASGGGDGRPGAQQRPGTGATHGAGASWLRVPGDGDESGRGKARNG